MSRADWQKVIRFTAAQDVRTPARYFDDIARWNREMPTVLSDALTSVTETLKQTAERGERVPPMERRAPPGIPFAAKKHVDEDGQTFLQAEVLIGRSLWLHGIRLVLENTIEVLYAHRWSVLEAPPNFMWPTSDNPVIRLNYHSNRKYDFGGGWGNPGSEIVFPISPTKLLYTKVGDRHPASGTVSLQHAMGLRRLVCEHAHRFVFALFPDPALNGIRPRLVDAAMFKHERAEWSEWHSKQSKAERELIEGSMIDGA
jgi:hypothetical protein